MVWFRNGDRPFPEPMMTQLTDANICYQWPLLLTRTKLNPNMESNLSPVKCGMKLLIHS